MKGIDKMLKPLLGILEVSIPDAKPENNAAKFMEELVIDYVPEELPKDLVRKFVVDAVNKNPDKFELVLRDLNVKIFKYFESQKR